MSLTTTEKYQELCGVVTVTKERKHYFITYKTGEKAKLNILNNHVFKYYMSPNETFLEYPQPVEAGHEAKINLKKLSEYDLTAFNKSVLEDVDNSFSINTEKIAIKLDKADATMTVIDKKTNKEVFKEIKSLCYNDFQTIQTLVQNPDEHYFGGGMQNGRFLHKGKVIEIVNTNKWDDGGVSSPCPFYWSSYGYGVLRNTWQPGTYDFSYKHSSRTCHKEGHFDAFFFINCKPKYILKDYYELTGQPFLMPLYAFYQAHLDTFNRDYWVEVCHDKPGAILFEDGKYYKRYQPKELANCKGILQSLNGENNNYQFSAKSMIDRYKSYDMPLGWFVPNDGYGSGYGQTNTLEGDIENLKTFAEYARSCGVEVGLWTESNLHPPDPEKPKKGERDLDKEVGVAGVVALKADVAWIGSGYSICLSAIENAAKTFVCASKQLIRPMVITVDGWAGTQRCAGIWSGDQRGGEWEYIRFHIPTYIGCGLSGQPNIGSDMDGIFGGKDMKVNVRDYQWKTFTPLQLNMDGWGYNPKTPFAFDKEAMHINRSFLKLKSMLMPYNYTVAHESISGLPMVRAMLLEFPNERPAFTRDSQYQFMWGTSILVAPVYNDLENEIGESVRDGIYLPDSNQVWVDFFTGERYQGGMILNDVKVPLWKIPVYIKEGAIIPFTNPNNNPSEIIKDRRIFQIYPNEESYLKLYEDDGISTDYLKGDFSTTYITVLAPKSDECGDLFLTVNETQGFYNKMVTNKTTEFIIITSKFGKIKAAINEKTIDIVKAKTKEDYDLKEDVWFFDEEFVLNSYLYEFSLDNLRQQALKVKIRKVDVTKNCIQIKIANLSNTKQIFGSNFVTDKGIERPLPCIVEDENTPTSIKLTWCPVEGIAHYDVERDDVLFLDIRKNVFEYDGFESETEHRFRVRSRNDIRVSEWSHYIIGKTRNFAV